MNTREILETQVIIGNKYINTQLYKVFHRFKSKSVNLEDLWFVIKRLYPTFFASAGEANLICYVERKSITAGLAHYILKAKPPEQTTLNRATSI